MDKGLGPPPNPSRLPNGQGFRAPPPTLPDLQMDKGLGPPPTLHDLQMDKGLGPPPNPSRLANGQGFRPPPPTFTTCKRTRVAGPQPFMTWGGLQIDKGSPTLHDLQMDKVAPPNPSRLANGQGLGPRNPSRLGGGFQMDKGWGRLPNRQGLGAPQPRFANGQGLGPNPSRLPPTLHESQMDKGWGPQPFTTCEFDKGWGPPNPSRLANLKFCLDKHWGLQTIERLSIFHRGPGASPQSETSMTSPSSQNVRLSKFLNFA